MDNKSELKVFLRLAKRPHTAHMSLIQHPPSGIAYNKLEFRHYTQDVTDRKHQVKTKLWATFTKIFPQLFYIRSAKDYDVIHSTNGMLILNRKPWVVDFESYFFIALRPEIKGLRHALIKSLLNSQNCKFLLPWSEAAKKSLLYHFPELEEKSKVVYPAIESTKFEKQKDDDIIRIMFAGRRTLEKGGYEVIQAFEELSKEYKNIRLTFIAPVEENVKRTLSDKVELLPPSLTLEQLNNQYKRSDIFAMPSYVDTYGMVFLHAMDFMLPSIGCNTYATPEIIEDKMNGLVVENDFSPYDSNLQHKWKVWDDYVAWLQSQNRRPAVEKVKEALRTLIEDEALRRKMGKNGKQILENGKLSISERNKALVKIYRECL